MNRLRGDEEVHSLSVSSSTDLRASGRRSDGLHRFFVPAGYTDSYQYPLIVWLHHKNGCAEDVNQVLPHLSLQNYVGVGFQADIAEDDCGSVWERAALVEHQVSEAIESAQARFSIHPRRIFLAGYRDGGTSAIRVALAMPQAFAGAVCVGGVFPRGGRVLGNLQAAQALPMYFGAFRECPRWSTEAICDAVRLCHAAQLKVEVREYVGEPELCTEMLNDLNRWIMSIVTGVPVEEPDRQLLFSAN